MADTTASAGFPNLGPRVAATKHPIYSLFEKEWKQLGDVREGTGGFIDGTYLVAHPREWEDHAAPVPVMPTKKLKARRALSRYENIASAILETKKSSLFRESPNRRVQDTPVLSASARRALKKAKKPQPEPVSPLDQWWLNVDGRGTHIDDAVPAWWDLAATFGHIVLYFEQQDDGEVVTAADQGTPFVRLYTPLDVLNWLSDDDGKIISLKVLEAVQATTYNELRPVLQYRIRIIDEHGWKVYDFKSGKAIESGTHDYGRLPVAFLYGKRRSILSDVGQPVLGDPRNYINVFNLESEKRELLRNQTFSFINVPLGSGDAAMGVEDAKALLGTTTGTSNVLFSGLPAQMLTAEAANVAAYQAEIEDAKRSIYRECGVQWESDIKGVEAKGSLELKREDMNVRLSAYADECQTAEYILAELFYRGKYGAEAGKKKFDEDDVMINYPNRFGATPFDEVLLQAQSAISLGMPTEVLKELRKALLTKFEGMANLPAEMLQKLNDAIDNAEADLTPAEQMQAKIKVAASDGSGAPSSNQVAA